MKKILAVLITFIATSASAGGLLNKVDLRICSKDNARCLSVVSENAQGSSLTSSYYMKNPVLTLKGEMDGKKFSSGYVDFENDQIILRDRKSNNITEELLINLKTLEQSRFVTKDL